MLILLLNYEYVESKPPSNRDKFNKAIDLILMENQEPGKRDDSILSLVFNLCFVNTDTFITEERKLDMLFLMYWRNHYAFNSLCGMVRKSNGFLCTDTLNCFIIYTFTSACYSVNCEFLDYFYKNDSLTFNERIDEFPVYYKQLFRNINKIVLSSKTTKDCERKTQSIQSALFDIRIFRILKQKYKFG